jgi:hypothetical protein
MAGSNTVRTSILTPTPGFMRYARTPNLFETRKSLNGRSTFLQLVRRRHGRLGDLPRDPWSEIYYGDETLASIRDSYIVEGHSAREESKVRRLAQLPSNEYVPRIEPSPPYAAE